MSVIVIPVGAPLVPHPAQMARNGLHANSFYATRFISLANHAARYRPKCVAVFTNPGLQAGFPLWDSGQPMNRDRWKFVYHSSPYCGTLRFEMLTFRQQLEAGFTPVVAAEYEITARTMAGAVISEAVIQGGAAAMDLNDQALALRNMFVFRGVLVDPTTLSSVNMTPDTDFEVTITEHNFGRIVGITIYEDSLGPDTANGYTDPHIATLSPIYSATREGVATIMRDMWKRGSAHLFNWSRLIDEFGDVLSPSTTSATYVNLIDGASTTQTGATPGFFMDLSAGMERLSVQGAVSAKMQVYAKCSTNGNGSVKLQQLSGGDIEVGPFTTSFTWVSTTGALDTEATKFDLFMKTAAGTLTVGAVSVYLLD